jgi:hypothetical protein
MMLEIGKNQLLNAYTERNTSVHYMGNESRFVHVMNSKASKYFIIRLNLCGKVVRLMTLYCILW